MNLKIVFSENILSFYDRITRKCHLKSSKPFVRQHHNVYQDNTENFKIWRSNLPVYATIYALFNLQYCQREPGYEAWWGDKSRPKWGKFLVDKACWNGRKDYSYFSTSLKMWWKGKIDNVCMYSSLTHQKIPQINSCWILHSILLPGSCFRENKSDK